MSAAVVHIDGAAVRVDQADLRFLGGLGWRVQRYGARRKYVVAQRGQEKVYLHRHLLGLGLGDPLVVDHVDGDGLNNSRSNLRACTPKENAWNKTVRRSSTGFVGVYRQGKGYIARLVQEGESVYLGYYLSAIEAAARVNVELLRRRGDFASLNVIDRGELEATVADRIAAAEAEIADLRSLLNVGEQAA